MSKSAIKNKDLSYDIARACKVPINEASKILYILLETLVKDLRKNKILKIRDFGRFKLTKYKRVHLPSGEYVDAAKYSVSFRPRGKLEKILKNTWYSRYAWTLANKFARLVKQGDIKGAKKTKKMLRRKLRGNWSMARWLDDRGRLPYRLWKKRPDDV